MKLFIQILFGIALFILLLIGGFWGASKYAARPGPEAEPLSALSDTGLQAAIEGVAAERKLVGMAARVVVNGETVAKAVTGTRRKDDVAALTLTDTFHVGSIGKSMTATVIATLVEEGALSWDDTLATHLSETVPMETGWEDVTLEHLLTHRAGVPRPGLSDMLRTATDPDLLHTIRREVAANLLAEPPTVEPGTTFAYSNGGYALASIMAEEASGQSWESLVRTRLIEPLGLSTVGFGAPTGETAPWGHRRIGPIKLSIDPSGGADNPAWSAAAGTLHMRIDDLLTYGAAHLAAGDEEDPLLSANTFSHLHTPILNDYAHGWVVQSRDLGAGDETVIWHNGSNTMWYAVLFLLPERNAMIALVTNDGSSLDETNRQFGELGQQIMEAIVAAEER